MLRYIFQAFLMYSLTLLVVAVVLEDIQSTYADWIMYAWIAVVGEFLLERPVSALWNKKKE